MSRYGILKSWYDIISLFLVRNHLGGMQDLWIAEEIIMVGYIEVTSNK